MTSAVFDYAEIAKKANLPVFNPSPPPPPNWDFSGTDKIHCNVCPFKQGESCSKPCQKVRDELTAEDGVIVKKGES